MIVFLLAKALDEVLDQDALFATGELVEVVPQVEHLPLCYRPSFLYNRCCTIIIMLLNLAFLHFEENK